MFSKTQEFLKTEVCHLQVEHELLFTSNHFVHPVPSSTINTLSHMRAARNWSYILIFVFHAQQYNNILLFQRASFQTSHSCFPVTVLWPSLPLASVESLQLLCVVSAKKRQMEYHLIRTPHIVQYQSKNEKNGLSAYRYIWRELLFTVFDALWGASLRQN